MKLFLLGILVSLSVMGCASVRTWTLEASKEDLANAVISREIADNLMSTWSLNSGAIQCGLEDYLPPIHLRKIQRVDALTKTAGKWNQQDYDRGCFLGARGDLTYEQLKTLYEQLLPIVLKLVGGLK